MRGAPVIPRDVLGIDAGASLIKLAHATGTELVRRSFAAREMDALIRCAQDAGARAIGLTGAGAHALAAPLASARLVGEFEAWLAGAPLLAQLAGLDLPEVYLLVSVGTGVSAILVRGGSGLRVGGTALGGGSLLGLGQLLLGTRSFEEIVALAQRGDRGRVDLSVGDVYAHGGAPLPPEVPASHFAKLQSTAAPDLAAALIGTIGQNLGLICGQLALTYGASAVVYCGSTLPGNPPLQAVLEQQTAAYRVSVCFPEAGAFCGALGAASLAAR